MKALFTLPFFGYRFHH